MSVTLTWLPPMSEESFLWKIYVLSSSFHLVNTSSVVSSIYAIGILL